MFSSGNDGVRACCPSSASLRVVQTAGRRSSVDATAHLLQIDPIQRPLTEHARGFYPLRLRRRGDGDDRRWRALSPERSARLECLHGTDRLLRFSADSRLFSQPQFHLPPRRKRAAPAQRVVPLLQRACGWRSSQHRCLLPRRFSRPGSRVDAFLGRHHAVARRLDRWRSWHVLQLLRVPKGRLRRKE